MKTRIRFLCCSKDVLIHRGPNTYVKDNALSSTDFMKESMLEKSERAHLPSGASCVWRHLTGAVGTSMGKFSNKKNQPARIKGLKYEKPCSCLFVFFFA